MVDRKLVAAALYEALEDADADLRRRKRSVFRKVDAVKHRKGWEAFVWMRAAGVVSDDRYRIAECEWCGDPFVAEKDFRCCDRTCAQRLRRFRARRQRVTVTAIATAA